MLSKRKIEKIMPDCKEILLRKKIKNDSRPISFTRPRSVAGRSFCCFAFFGLFFRLFSWFGQVVPAGQPGCASSSEVGGTAGLDGLNLGQRDWGPPEASGQVVAVKGLTLAGLD